MVNVLLAASPATRSRPRAIKGQETGLVDVLLQPTEQTRSHTAKPLPHGAPPSRPMSLKPRQATIDAP